MRRFSVSLAASGLCLLVVAGASPAKQPAGEAAGYTLVANPPGSATLVHPGYGSSTTAVQLMSTGQSGWGAIGFAVPRGLTLGDVTTLSTEYNFLPPSSCWEGSPRFTIGVSYRKTHEIYFYIGPPPSFIGCTSGWTNTGNLASSTSFVDDSSLPGGSFADPFEAAKARYGGYAIKYIAIDLDGGFAGTQIVDFDNTQVDNTAYSYEQ